MWNLPEAIFQYLQCAAIHLYRWPLLFSPGHSGNPETHLVLSHTPVENTHTSINQDVNHSKNIITENTYFPFNGKYSWFNTNEAFTTVFVSTTTTIFLLQHKMNN